MTEKGTDVLVEESSIGNGVLKNASSRTTIASSVREVDGLVVLGMSQDDLDFYEGFSPQMRSGLNRKVCRGAIPVSQCCSSPGPREALADCPVSRRLTFECYLFSLLCTLYRAWIGRT